jgi:CRISPR/Cas system-associated exonuclease Cas4 (RecB family)
VRPLENRLTWSKSRAETFDACLRKYWWQYYGSWGGWASDAPPEAREAYLLKNLHSRWTWVGDVVHRTIEGILRRLLRRRRPTGDLGLGDEGGIDPAAEVEALTRAMRSEYRESREGRYRADPKRIVGLVEHEYGVAVPDAEWKEMNRRAVDAVGRFLASPTYRDIASSDPATWLPFEELDSFDFEGTSVWAALDFGRRTPDGGAEVYDWKTGEERPDANTLQLLCYALYVEQKHKVPATRVRGRLVYVNTGGVHEVVPTEPALAAARRTMRASIAEMRRRLEMGGGPPAPSKLAFPMIEDLAACATCSFRRLCGR